MASPTDPLFFISEQTVSNSRTGIPSSPPSINPVHFILNVVFVLIILYLTLLLIRLVYRKTSLSNPHLLKEIPLGQTSKLQYIKIGNKLYLLAQNNNHIIHLDTITDPQAIIDLLSENKDTLPQPALTWGTLLNFFHRNKSTEIEPEHFDSTLKKIIQNSNKLEDLNSR